MSQLCRFQPLTYPFGILCHVFAVIVERRRFARVYSAGNTFGLLLFALGRCPRVSLGPLNEETGRFVELFHNLRSCGGDGAGREREREDPQGVEEKTGSEKRRRRTRERSERLRQRIQSDQTSRCSSRTDAVT